MSAKIVAFPARLGLRALAAKVLERSYRMPEITVMCAPTRLELLEAVATAARLGLFKLDIQFRREPGVEHLEGWAEANQLRYALENLDADA